MQSPSWLIKDGSDRERMLDMDRRIQPVRARTFAVLGLALLVSVPWVGWWTVAPLILAAGLFQWAERNVEKRAWPEYWLFGAWAGAEAIIASSLALTGKAAVLLLCVMLVPIVTLSARFSARGVLIGVAATLGLMLAVAFGTNPHAVIADPPLLVSR
jgi:hypothetical protein